MTISKKHFGLHGLYKIIQRCGPHTVILKEQASWRVRQGTDTRPPETKLKADDDSHKGAWLQHKNKVGSQFSAGGGLSRLSGGLWNINLVLMAWQDGACWRQPRWPGSRPPSAIRPGWPATSHRSDPMWPSTLSQDKPEYSGDRAGTFQSRKGKQQ